nr:glycosyl hydrolase 115 family protein [Chitinophagaceae bacterium]
WPAMWGNAFYDDDSANIHKAKEYGIVIGTSHHEPLMRAHDEWRRYGKGKWNYDSNAVVLREFWKGGLQRAANEKIVTVGMRGDGDEPMSRETATALLERIVNDQRKIITEVTKKPAEETPQLWALYKEVQDYYDKGMRVPDDVTLLLCDDNWGNIRRLPDPKEKPRKGGYGIYYHFDYVGGPRNYKWINTNHISRIWEQMHLAWQYNARQIWIVNVGDIKPMEFPISFFLDHAWNPEKFGANDLLQYTETWAAHQFGNGVAKDVAYLYNTYSKINSRRKPELLDANTFTFHYNEWNRVVDEYDALLEMAQKVQRNISADHQDAYFQLILHPIKATTNLYRMYHAVALNKKFASQGDTLANVYARKVRQYYNEDSLITLDYHRLNHGKWNHMMSQTHIGYTYWQQPPVNRMPNTEFVFHYNQRPALKTKLPEQKSAKDLIPAGITNPAFYELNGMASIYADHFSRKRELSGIEWRLLPGHGRTGNAMTTFPVTHPLFENVQFAPSLEYDLYTYSADTAELHFYFSPTLNFLHHPNGLQFAVSVNDSEPTINSINQKDYDSRTWEGWVASNVITVKSKHKIEKPGKQIIRYWPLHPGMVLQKIVCDFGGLQPSFLGPEETLYK